MTETPSRYGERVGLATTHHGIVGSLAVRESSSLELRDEEAELLDEDVDSFFYFILFVGVFLFAAVFFGVRDEDKAEPLHDLQIFVVEDTFESLVLVLREELGETRVHDLFEVLAFEASFADQPFYFFLQHVELLVSDLQRVVQLRHEDLR